MAEKLESRQIKIAGQPFKLDRKGVVRALRGLEPEPIKLHYVVVGLERFPPKQVIGAATGLDRADFTTHQARRTLKRLGFNVGRRAPSTSERKHLAGTDPDKGADDPARWKPFVGQWVALKDDELLRAADSPQALVTWLTRNDERADTMFRVPEGESEATGLAPL